MMNLPDRSSFMASKTSLDLSYIDPTYEEMAIEAFNKKEPLGILCCFDNDYGIDFVSDNVDPLIRQGIYEETLIHAYVGCRVNWCHWSLKILKQLFGYADKERLLEAGDKLPSEGPFKLFRGVSGTGNKRKVRGISWTASFERAKRFAERLADVHPNPAVFSAVVPKEYVYAYYNGRNEKEFLCNINNHLKIEEVWSN